MSYMFSWFTFVAFQISNYTADDYKGKRYIIHIGFTYAKLKIDTVHQKEINTSLLNLLKSQGYYLFSACAKSKRCVCGPQQVVMRAI